MLLYWILKCLVFCFSEHKNSRGQHLTNTLENTQPCIFKIKRERCANMCCKDFCYFVDHTVDECIIHQTRLASGKTLHPEAFQVVVLFFLIWFST